MVTYYGDIIIIIINYQRRRIRVIKSKMEKKVMRYAARISFLHQSMSSYYYESVSIFL
jgi:hypothetical protein